MNGFGARHWSIALLLAAALQAGGALWLLPSEAREPTTGSGGIEISLSLAGELSAGDPDGDVANLEPITAPQPPQLPPPRPEPVKPKPKPEPKPAKPTPAVIEPTPAPPPPSKAPVTRSATEPTAQQSAEPAQQSVASDETGDQSRSEPAAPRGAGGKGGGAATGMSAAQLDYFSQVAAALNRHKRYPYPAKRARHEGIVKLRFVIERDGTVTHYEIADSSGYPLLDNATIEMVKRASPLPPIPAHLKRDRLTIALPIEFSLRRR